MQIHELAALTGNPASGNVLAIDTGSVTRKIDYTALANAVVTQYNGATLAGTAQTVKSAVDALNTAIGDTGDDIDALSNVAVKHEAQTLTDTQKGTARENIMAVKARLYQSENALDISDTSMYEVGKTLTSTGGFSDNANYVLFKIPVNGIDGHGYHIYGPNSNNTMYVSKSQRAAMFDANGNLISMLVNNQDTQAYITNANCRYLYMSAGVASALSDNTVMILKDANSVYVSPNDGIIPRETKIMPETPWTGRTWAVYGDSIGALTNGDFLGASWARYVNKYMGFGAFHGRSIGAQKFAFETNGGSVCFIKADGNLNSRNDGYNYDNYTGTVPTGCTKVRGAFSSWLRITTMFPASIKDTIDMVFIMGGTNDSTDDTALSWVANSTVDPEWAASDYYATYGGDYNIASLRGGVASAIMKMQAWMPNALIVIGTPCNGKTQQTGSIRPDFIPPELSKAQQIKEVANRFGCPVVDVFATCGINTLNSPTYISDGTHPGNPAGFIRLAKAITGGLRGIEPIRG